MVDQPLAFADFDPPCKFVGDATAVRDQKQGPAPLGLRRPAVTACSDGSSSEFSASPSSRIGASVSSAGERQALAFPQRLFYLAGLIQGVFVTGQNQRGTEQGAIVLSQQRLQRRVLRHAQADGFARGVLKRRGTSFEASRIKVNGPACLA